MEMWVFIFSGDDAENRIEVGSVDFEHWAYLSEQA